jgi:hypothetical protein
MRAATTTSVVVDPILDFVPVRRDETGEFFLVVPWKSNQPEEPNGDADQTDCAEKDLKHSYSMVSAPPAGLVAAPAPGPTRVVDLDQVDAGPLADF